MIRKALSFLIICLCYSTLALAQKKALSLDDAINWPRISVEQISNDGKYIFYSVESQLPTVKIVKAVSGNWERKITGNKPVPIESKFTEDSRRLIFLQADSSLGILDLAKDSVEQIADVLSFATPEEGNGEWLICRFKKEKKILLCNLWTGERMSYKGVSQYKFNNNGTALLLTMEDKTSNASLLWIILNDRKEKILARNGKIGQPVFNSKGDHIIFTTAGPNGRNPDVRIFTPGMDSASILVNGQSTGFPGMIININNTPFFSYDDRRVFFYTDDTIEIKKETHAAYKRVEIRRYDDETNSPYFKDQTYGGPYLATIQPEEKKAARIQMPGDQFFFQKTGDQIVYEKKCSGEIVLLIRGSLVDKVQEINQPQGYLSERYDIIVSLPGRERIAIKKSVRIFRGDVRLSPSERYAYWFDMDNKNWIVYDVKNGVTRNATNKIMEPLTKEADGKWLHGDVSSSMAWWTPNDSTMLIQDRFSDVWSIDPLNKRSPVNISRAFAKKNQMRFKFIGQTGQNRRLQDNGTITETDTLLFSVIDRKTMESGFYTLPSIRRINDPEKMVMSASVYSKAQAPDIVSNAGDVRSMVPPVKAKSANVYLLKKMSTSQSPTVCVTNDFKTFTPLTDIQPHKEYNWFTTELHHWKLPDGKTGSGILYKPENFDSSKRYPVLFSYYEQGTGGMNYYINHSLSDGTLPIPWFVSNGYLVFIPDIYYTTGSPGASACNSVVSAANYLSKLSFVDSKHMGLQGHSFGGYETNYIVSHSALFAAAAPAAGVSDLISGYSDESRGLDYYETGQGRMGNPLWVIPESYVKNSPIFSADKVIAPILMLHNKNDPLVHYIPQAIEWYNLLVRAGKKVWMLSYDAKGKGGRVDGHGLENPDSKYDYSIKLMQFFDHFLKGKPKPDWM